MAGQPDGRKIRPPSILHLHTEMTWGGGENQAFHLVKSLDQAGYGVSVAALPGSRLAARCRESGLETVEMRMASDLDLGAAWRIARLARQQRCHILHAHTARAHALGLLARLMGAPSRLVVSRRVSFPLSSRSSSRLKYRSRRVDLYLAVAQAIREILLQAGVPAARIQVIHDGINLSTFQDAFRNRTGLRTEVRKELHLPGATPLVGHVGALVPCKAQRDLIDAFPQILETVPTAHLLLVGAGENRPHLESRIRALELSGQVHLLGFREDVPRLLASLDVFVMSSALEGFCSSVLEAFALQVPVVSTRTGALPEMPIEGKDDFLVPIHDPPALAAAITQVFGNRDRAGRFAAAGRALVEKEYTMARMVEETCAAYQTVLAHRV